jgi:hypothetical protein
MVRLRVTASVNANGPALRLDSSTEPQTHCFGRVVLAGQSGGPHGRSADRLGTAALPRVTPEAFRRARDRNAHFFERRRGRRPRRDRQALACQPRTRLRAGARLSVTFEHACPGSV